MNNEEYYMENVIIDRDDLYINMDKFESGKCNVILVTGFSGSGKSTLGQEMVSKYKCDDHIELDALEWWFNKAITEDELKNGLTPIYDWLIHHKSEMNMEKPTEKQIMEMYDDAIPYVINWCKKHSDKKYVIDGIQLYENWANKGKCQYLSYPMVLKGTSGLKSTYRAMKRNGNKLSDVPFYLKWLFQSNKQVEALYKAMKEAYENEEVTEEAHDHHDEVDAMRYAMDFLNKYSEYSKESEVFQEESFMSEYLQSSHPRKKKKVMNDEGKEVPDKCTKCGGDIGVFIQGEPVYLCKNCKKYFGTVKFPSKKKNKPLTESVDQECDYVFTEDSKFDFEKAMLGTDYVKNLRKVDILNAKLKNKKITQEQFDKEYAKISTVNADGFVMTIPKNGSEGGKPKVVRPNKDKPGSSFKEIKKSSNDKSSYNGNIKSKSDAEKFDHYNDILRRTEDYREYKDAFKNMARLLGNPTACTIKIMANSRGGKINGECFNRKQSAGCSSSDKLYHTSNQKGITRLNGKFRGHEGFYFSSKRVYFHKNNPGSINTSSNTDYIAKDGEYVYQFMGNPSSAFVDPEIKGSAVFIETDTSIPVKDVTDQFKKKSKPVQESAESDYSYSYLKDSDIPEFYDSFEKTFHTRDCGLNKSEIKKGMQAIKFDNKVIGYIGFSYYNEKGKKYMGIGNFMIKPEYQGKGHGTNVIADIIEKNKDKYDEIYCYVDKKNTAAISFYKKIGTVDTDHLTKYGYYVTLYSKDTKPYQEESFMSEYLQSSHKRKKKVVRNDKDEIVPDKCPKCGGDIGVFIQGEPVYLCKNCKKYFGTVKFPSKKKKAVMESVDPECECLVAFMEAAVKNTTILKDLIYPIVEKIFTTQANVRKYKMLISQFFEKNTPKLTTPGPQYLIVFGDADKDEFYKLFGITKEEIVFAMKNVIKSAGSSAEFKYLTNNPFLSFLYYIIRYFTLHHDDKALNATLGLFSIDVYWSIFTKYFPNGVIEPVMNYTIDNLTDKFIIKKAGTIFGALTESAKHSYEFHKPKIRTGNDPDCIAFLQRIRNDQNSMFRTISGIYYDNHKKGNAITTRNDDYDPENPILDDITSASTEVQATVNRVCMPMIANGVDISLAEAAAAIGNVSVTNLRIYLMKIFVNERLDEITQIVESILFLYINGEHKSSRDIRSAHFLYWTYALFKKTNSKDGNIVRINTILNRWGEETGIYKAFKSEGSKINYKRAIFTYIAMCIQKYN